MTLNVNEFVSKINQKGGFLATSKYQVQFPPVEGNTASIDALNLFCINLNMPGRQLMSQDRRIGIKLEKMIDGYAVDDVSMSFYMPADNSVKKYFEAWGNLAIPSRSGTVRYKTDYEKDVKIFQLNKDGTKAYGCLLIEAFPTTLQPVELNGGAQNAISQYGVQLSYTDWIPIDISGAEFL